MSRLATLVVALFLGCGGTGRTSDGCAKPTTACVPYMSQTNICVDLHTDPDRCGGCAHACDAPSCSNGVCFECSARTTGRWLRISPSQSPGPRAGHTAVWTGTEMIIWGGSTGAAATNTGGRYDPALDRWTIMNWSDAPAPRTGHSAVWTGTEMIVWGGFDGGDSLDTGGRYDPATDSWVPLTIIGAPEARADHVAVWTGDRMLVWGGSSVSNIAAFDTGGRYDPLTDTWSPMTTTDAPAPRATAIAAWTGSELLVWSGYSQVGPNSWGVFATGGRYDPLTDAWRPMSTVAAPLVGQQESPGIWTGSELIMVGSLPGPNAPVASGAFAYDPSTDSWRQTGPRCDRRTSFVGAWTGAEVVLWGGMVQEGLPDCAPQCHDLSASGPLHYDPSSDSWSKGSADSEPSGRLQATAVWTGTELLVFGGIMESTYEYLGTGSRYQP